MGQIPELFTYDVFLGFRGLDVRRAFIPHLYHSLRRSGINTFMDDKELERGAVISPSLLKAIENSRVHLVVLSENYASSSWCLDELVHIMECHRSNSKHVVYPIFYEVDPSDVRRQTGSYGASFPKHEKRYPEKVQKWKEALTEVANLSGLSRANFRDNAKFVEKITKEIRKMSSISYLHLPTYAVGMTQGVKDIYELLCFGSANVQTIGICGMGGIGKTTLAKAAFNEFADRFEGTCFLENIGESSKDQLQQKLLSHILRRDDIGSNNLDHEVSQRFRKKRVLVVIDDVKDFIQFNSIAIDSSCFGPGSRIIITGRDKHLLELFKAEKIYSPKALNSNDSLKLVRSHAFRTSEPSEALLQLSEKLAEYCGGLPLAMEVLGTLLFKESISVWESTLESLKSIPNDNIQAKLQISFDALNEVQKDIFLDISCFFIGMDEDYVSCILDGCNFFPKSGLSVLKNRCLITVRDNKLMMHDLLRDMGREIVKGTSRDDCEKWSRLWVPVDIIGVLRNCAVRNKISINSSSQLATKGLSLKAEVTAVENFEVKAFSYMERLRLLQLSHVHLKGSYENFPKRLRWLCWLGFPRHSFPTDFFLGSLVVMDMQYSNLKQLWGDRKQSQILTDLKYLDLSHSVQLTHTPNFTNLPNLEKLLLINCKKLVRVHKSIGRLQNKLKLLNLKGCTKLGDLPLEFYSLTSLETLILSGCSQLERLNDAVSKMSSLTTLKADYTAIAQIPSSICQLKKIKELSFEGCKGSPQAALSIPFSLNRLSCLKTLRLGFCNLSDVLVPENLGSLSCLEELDLRGNNFHNLQTDFAGLENLQILKLDDCSELHSMFSLPETLRSFSATNCRMLERTPDLSKCLVFQSLHLTYCCNLVETPGLDKLKTVGVIHMEMCNRIPDTYRESIMQGWAVGANGGIFIPGLSLPDWVSFKNKTHSISFTVPETLNPDLVGFTVWTLYVGQKNEGMSEYSPNITLKNQTKSYVWRRNPATDMIHMHHKKHIWQGHFSNEDFFLETGDQLEVSVDFGDQVTILETGVTLAYREANTDISDIDTSNIGYEEIAVEQLIQTEEVDDELVIEEIADEQLIQTEDELVTEENQSRAPRKRRGDLEELLMVLCLALIIMYLISLEAGQEVGS